ncbi:hypothetical protein M1293_02345 [Candidatus Parvarchaeota archaeon]|nr:hypothetical protein [Candidatus Parvarchaeota archaeon]
MEEWHKRLSNIAIKLSVYSSFLDFGLTVSVLLLQRKDIPFVASSILVSIFDNAIAYLTVVIIAFFSAALVLKHRSKIIKIYVSKKKNVNVPKHDSIKVYMSSNNAPPAPKQLIVKQAGYILQRDSPLAQRVVNKRKDSFIKFNGIWYKASENKFDRVPRPEYD